MAQSEISAQSIFDKTVTHLFGQTERSEMERPKWGRYCAYRGDNGNMCAVGIHIPDADYESDMDDGAIVGGTCANAIINRYDSLSHLAPHIDLLGSLQNIHDDCERDASGLEQMYCRLLTLAEAGYFDQTVIKQFAPEDF